MLQPLLDFLRGNLAAWYGLPAVRVQDLVSAFGSATSSTSIDLGAAVATRLSFSLIGEARTLVAYSRQDEVVMVEAEPPPDLSALAPLGAPTSILPQEIWVPGAYAHEYVYDERGLLVTVAEHLDGSALKELVRCRGIRAFAFSERIPSDLYLPLDAKVVF